MKTLWDVGQEKLINIMGRHGILDILIDVSYTLEMTICVVNQFKNDSYCMNFHCIKDWKINYKNGGINLEMLFEYFWPHCDISIRAGLLPFQVSLTLCGSVKKYLKVCDRIKYQEMFPIE